MKIDVRSKELLNGKKEKYKLSHKVRFGLVTAALVLGIPGMMFLNSPIYAASETPTAPGEGIPEVVA